MAIIKHIPMKTSDYTQSIHYLIFRHDERTQKEITDGYGTPVLRDDFILEGINCSPYAYDAECRELNRAFHKNLCYGDVKQHHYIISFDPKDAAECGLTCEKAQALGMEYAGRNFPGHQMLVCTHPDGHNRSGNIHVHIIFNSLRKLDVEERGFMERGCDRRAGYKHHSTPRLLRHLKADLMKMCRREKLHQTDLLTPAKKRIPDGEYHAAKRGKEKSGNPSRFATQKEFLRNAVDDIAKTAASEKEFARRLKKEYGIGIKVTRGRYSYIHPDRGKPIRGRSLGSGYEETCLIPLFEKNRSIGGGAPRPNTEISGDAPMKNGKTSILDALREDRRQDAGPADSVLPEEFTMPTGLGLVADLQACAKAKASAAYARKVRLSNLQNMAKTIAFIQEQGIGSRESLDAAVKETWDRTDRARHALKGTQEKLKKVNEQIHYTGQYLANRKTFRQFMVSGNKELFHHDHRSELALYRQAREYLKTASADGRMEPLEQLKQKKEKLLSKQSAQKERYVRCRKERQVLDTAKRNVDAMLTERGHGLSMEMQK
ncbi:MAG: relaxase/mobilization nuclease domain-containing protein [Lachnospiraceae bacterium]|nr:relaxase/mobilization nuclease domain-containing protein [Lachnospiraceae bacterium]